MALRIAELEAQLKHEKMYRTVLDTMIDIAERVNGILKTEWIYYAHFGSFGEAKTYVSGQSVVGRITILKAMLLRIQKNLLLLSVRVHCSDLQNNECLLFVKLY